ncbi:hypothetical protein [Pedobacter insulae]|uniref:Uncharacterized protein n=1 Tax=Pedobacter insulae TaxID=414048 RepID=A0A1I2TLU4_9SPHI|nr:hypothetical protein [Pedobacter insulae]SFG65915.1 hypothetical protein SAMN04489864_101484 [Pedobacter insulae]
MAKQESFIKLQGKVGDLSFFKTKSGYQARVKGGVSADRIKNDPAYQRTRENNAEFAAVSVAAKNIRDLLRSMILQTHDPKMATRLSSRLFRMMKADTSSLRGERKVTAASFGILKDFNFNEAAPLNNTLFVDAISSINRATGVVEMSLPEIKPEIHLAKPKAATHFRLTAGTALITLDQVVERSDLQLALSDYAPVTGTIPPMVLTGTLPPNAVGPIVLALGVNFYQEVNGVYYSLINGAFNTLCIVAVDTA